MTSPPDAREGRWSRYPETVLYFASESEIMVDLRTPVSTPVRDALASLGFGDGFAVLTAFNPQGRNIDREENDVRQAELESELRSSGDKFLRVDACSPDRSHCECSVALVAPQHRAIDIARRFEQIAIFWYDGAAFWIVGVLVDTPSMRLPAKNEKR